MVAMVAKGPWFGMRHVQILLIFLNTTVIYFSRLNISMALVAMTNAATTNPNFPEFDWSLKEQSYILSSFSWGYVILQFPGGYIVRRFGTQIVMLCSTLSAAVCSLITPYCVSFGGWQAFCIIRIVQGLFQGVLFPSIHEHIAKWSPEHERTRLGALSYSGLECGTVLSLALSGLIAAGPMGWPGISYVSGALCLAWCVLWLIFGASNAPASRFITQEELNYIESSLKREEGFHEKKIPVPWRAIFTSVPFYTLLIVSCCEGWGSVTFFTQMPTYLNGVLNMNIKDNSLYTTLPYILMWAMSYIFLFVADIAMKRKWGSVTNLRKTINTFGSWMSAASLLGACFLDDNNKGWALILVAVSLSFKAGTTIGSSLNTIDLSPNHAGILMGIKNCVSNFTVLLMPLFASQIVHNKSDQSQWQIVFIVGSLAFFFGNLVYIIFGTSEVQRWNEPDYLLERNDKSLEANIHKSNPIETSNIKNSLSIEKKTLEI